MKQISAFDLDHTLISSNSSLLFYRYLIAKGLYHPITLIETLFYALRHRFLSLSLTSLHQKVFDRFLKGTPLSFVQEEVVKFLEKDFYSFIYYPTFERLRWAQHRGHYTVILSNAPSFIVGPISDYLEVNQWCASHYSVDEKGNFEAIESILVGEDKARCLCEIIQALEVSPEEVTAYSDSHLDLPFLLSAGRAVAVNPNAKLLKICKENFWEII